MEEKGNKEIKIPLKFDYVVSVIENGDCDKLKVIFENGQFDNINEPEVLSGPTLLMIACKSGSIDCVKVLLDHKANLNNPNQYYLLLHYACESGSVEMVRFIIASGLKINDEAIMSVFAVESLIKTLKFLPY